MERSVERHGGSVWSRQLAFALAIGTATLLCLFFHEKLGVNHGLGWDGSIYGAWAKRFFTLYREAPPDDYYVQRLLPSFVAHLALLPVRGSEAAIKNQDVVYAFGMMNVVALVLAGWAWGRVSHLLGISRRGAWLGVALLFGSFAVLKWPAYYPVLGDSWGFALGLLMLGCHLQGHRIKLTLLGFLGAFIWPTALPVAVLLLGLPRGTSGWPPREHPGAPLSLWLAVLAATSWLLVTVVVGAEKMQLNGVEPRSGSVFRASCLAACAYLGFALVPLLRAATACLRLPSAKRAVLMAAWAAALLIAAKLAHSALAGSQSPMGVLATVKAVAYFGSAKPFVQVISHTVFFGPLFLLLCLRWKAVTRRMAAEGLGLVAVAALGLLLSVGSESRHVLTFAAIVLPFALRELDQLALSRSEALTLAVGSLAYSRIWWTFPTDSSLTPLEFPGQVLFMTQGPWMVWSTYAIQGVLVAGTGLWMHLWLRARTRAREGQGLPA